MSSSSIGARPVQSELRWPRMNLSSATLSSRSTRGCFRLSGSRSTSERLLQVLFLVVLQVLLLSEFQPTIVHLVTACEFVIAIGRAPNDVALVISAQHA